VETVVTTRFDNLKVLDSIVMTVSVDVMNVLSRKQRAA